MQSTINFGYLIFLSVVAALGGFLFGYDTAVISGTIAQVTQLFQLDALQQGWYVGCALVGSIIGVLFAGILSDKLGRKLTMVISAILFSASALGCALCTDFTQLVVYRIIGGVGIGVVSIVSPLYISEVSVAQYRGRLVSLYQLAVTVGFLGAYLVNYQLLAWSESGALLGVPLLNKIFITEVWRGMLAAVPRFAFQPFRDEAHILSIKAAGGLVKNQYPAAGKDGAGNGKALLLSAGQGGRVRAPVLIKPKLFEQVPCMALAFFCQSGIQQQLLRHACRKKLR